ncbi:restriction endonuclease subunit S [Lentilactobacillus buchneri subsp. silagei]|uniref:restriction endonuclease subunit S n=1 Tax=Lentilactobacillus buchneri TaxID=1581 RepID=UPI003AFA92FD
MGNKAMKIEDICKVSSSKRIFAREYVETGVPFWRGKEVTEHATGKNDSKGLFISAKRYNELKQTGNVPSDDDVLITAVGTIGSIYQIKHEDLPFYFKDGNIIRLSNWNTDRVNPTYVSLFLRSQIGQQAIKEVEIGSTQKALTIKDIAKVPILLPELKTQNDIAAAIGVIDAKIKINQQINKNLLKLSVLVFNKWLDSTQSNQYTSLDKIASFKNGIAMQKFSPTDKIHVLPVIKIRELNQGYIDSNSDSVTSVIDDDVKVHNGDLVFSWSGTLSAKIWTDGDAALNQHLFKVTSNRWPKWFYYLWVLHHLNTFRGIAADKKTTMGHIKRKDLTNAKVLIPNAKEFKNLDTILNPIIEQMVNGGIESKNLIDIRNILLPKLLSGSMDLSSIEETINND